MTELVSAIITTHNRLNLLKRAIESVQSQTYKELELIVVDDHSEDGTKDWCKHQNFKYIYIPKEDESRGGNYARNLGVKAARGRYCAFLDDDDYWLPEKIEKQVALIEEMGCELVHCGRRLEYIHNDGSISYMETLPDPNHRGNMSHKILTTICTTTISCILARREALIEVGLFDENLKFWQDYELTIRLAQRSPFYFVNEQLVVYRMDIRDGQRLTNRYFEWKDAVRYIHNKHAALYSKLSFLERIEVRDLYHGDATTRAIASGLRVRRYYHVLISHCYFFLMPERMKRKARTIAHRLCLMLGGE